MPLDVDVFVCVHEDVRDRRIFQQGFQRTKAEDFIQNLFCKTVPLGHADRKMILSKNSLERRLDFSPQFVPAFRFYRIHVQDVEKLLVDADLEISPPILVLGRGGSAVSRGSSGWNGSFTHGLKNPSSPLLEQEGWPRHQNVRKARTGWSF